MVKNLLSNAGDAGSIPGPGTKIPDVTGQLSERAVSTEPAAPQLEKPVCSKERSLTPPRLHAAENKQAFKKKKNINFCCLSCLFYGILLRQPQDMSILPKTLCSESTRCNWQGALIKRPDWQSENRSCIAACEQVSYQDEIQTRRLVAVIDV